MSKLIFSKTILDTGMKSSSGFNSISSIGYSGIFGTGTFIDDGQSRFFIAKGPIPTQAEVNGARAFTSQTFRASDVLIRFGTAKVNLKTITNPPIPELFTFVPSPAIALASGEASWFAFMNGNCTHMLVGSVSDLNGIGELKVLDTNIVQGKSYVLPPWNFFVPKTLEIA